MTYTLLTDADATRARLGGLGIDGRIALDCEAAGFHRYSDQLCLIQLSTTAGTVLIDTLAFDPAGVLREILENPATEVILHGADFDLRLLDRDLGIHVRGLIDTQISAALLGEPGIGLAPLVEKYLGVTLSKKYQRADWAERPLPEELLSYAASDTQHLHALADALLDRLEAAGRMSWAREEFELLEGIRWAQEEVDPVTRVKGARDLTPRQLAALREALSWRDQLARARDRAPFRVVGDQVLLAIVVEPPKSASGLKEVKGFSPSLARQSGQTLLDRIRQVGSLPEGGLAPYPRPVQPGPGRPTPEEDILLNRLKGERNRRAEALEIERGTLLPNSVLLEVVRGEPSNLEELADIPGVKRWQIEEAGEALLRALG
ncbi:MAG: ribonuclease D [Gemmatimonadetes bacterium]|nr:ribonuclease D [Gemmatimonadota bacterium]